MNNSTHISFDDYAPCRYAVSIFFTTAMAFISLATITGNTLVIASVYKTPSLRTSTNYYYVSMAISDLLSCVTTWPLYLTDESSGSLLQGSSIECKMAVFFRMVSTIVSVLSLVLIAVDRFIAIVFPLKAILLTRKLRAGLLFATWMISTAYCIPLLYHFKVVKIGQETLCKSAWNDFAIMIYYSTGFVLLEVIPFIVIIILYSRIMRVLRQRLNPEGNARSSNTQQNRNKQNQNIMKIFKSVVVVLFTWFSLFCLYLVLKMFSPDLFNKDRCKLIEGFAFYLIPLLSTATNPIILFSFSSNFRRTLPCGCRLPLGKFSSRSKGQSLSVQENDTESFPELVAYRVTPCY